MSWVGDSLGDGHAPGTSATVCPRLNSNARQECGATSTMSPSPASCSSFRCRLAITSVHPSPSMIIARIGEYWHIPSQHGEGRVHRRWRLWVLLPTGRGGCISNHPMYSFSLAAVHWRKVRPPHLLLRLVFCARPVLVHEQGNLQHQPRRPQHLLAWGAAQFAMSDARPRGQIQESTRPREIPVGLTLNEGHGELPREKPAVELTVAQHKWLHFLLHAPRCAPLLPGRHPGLQQAPTGPGTTPGRLVVAGKWRGALARHSARSLLSRRQVQNGVQILELKSSTRTLGGPNQVEATALLWRGKLHTPGKAPRLRMRVPLPLFHPSLQRDAVLGIACLPQSFPSLAIAHHSLFFPWCRLGARSPSAHAGGWISFFALARAMKTFPAKGLPFPPALLAADGDAHAPLFLKLYRTFAGAKGKRAHFRCI
jgi:hypothetical protein